MNGTVGAKSVGLLPNLFAGAAGNSHNEHTQSEQQLKAIITASQGNNEPTDPNEEAFIFKHFYNNRKGLIK